jgi:hypothetical protein
MKNIEMNHAEYSKKVKTMSIEALIYTIQDCKATLNANPEGHKAGYYADEINYCAMELSRRNGYDICVESLIKNTSI